MTGTLTVSTPASLSRFKSWSLSYYGVNMGYSVHIVQSPPSEVRASVAKLKALLEPNADLTKTMDRVNEAVSHFAWECLSVKCEFSGAMDRCTRKCPCCRTVLRDDDGIRKGISEVAMRVERMLAEFLESHPEMEDEAVPTTR